MGGGAKIVRKVWNWDECLFVKFTRFKVVYFISTGLCFPK